MKMAFWSTFAQLIDFVALTTIIKLSFYYLSLILSCLWNKLPLFVGGRYK